MKEDEAKNALLFVTPCHSPLYLDLSKFCFKKTFFTISLTSLMFILIPSSFTKSLMMLFSNPSILAYLSPPLLLHLPNFLLHLSSHDWLPYIHWFQLPPPCFQIWSFGISSIPKWFSSLLVITNIRLSDLVPHAKNGSNGLQQGVKSKWRPHQIPSHYKQEVDVVLESLTS